MSELERAANPTIEEAVKYLERMLFTQLRAKAVNTMAIAALREQAERSKGCEHCLLGVEIAYKAKSKHIDSKESYICLDGNILEADLYTEYMAVEVRYCPMCGKRLEVEHGN